MIDGCRNDRKAVPEDRDAAVAGDAADGAHAERGRIQARQDHSAQEVNRFSPSTAIHSTAHTGDRAARRSSRGRNVSRSGLSRLQRHILVSAVHGVERGEIIAELYGLERRYRGHHEEALLNCAEELDFQERYRRAQPAVTRALHRLEQRGLAQLERRGACIKQVRLTDDGRQVVDTLRVEGRTK